MDDLTIIKCSIIFILSLALCLLISRFHSRDKLPALNLRVGDLSAVQATHIHPTPRLGGFAIFIGFIACAFWAPISIKYEVQLIMLAAFPLFVAGLLEDIGYHITPKGRLLAAVFSSLLTAVVLGFWLPRFGLPAIDHYFSFAIIGIPLTLLVCSAMSNAVNLIDGVNGLAAGSSAVSFFGFMLISYQAGQLELMIVLAMIIAAILGFLMVNYPKGLIFLGDAGSYVLGHLIAWFGIVLMVRVAHISPWAILLCAFWPTADTLLAIFRRVWAKVPMMSADRAHFHHITMDILNKIPSIHGKINITNPLTTLVIFPFKLIPAAMGVYYYDRPIHSLLYFVIFMCLYVVSYYTLIYINKNWSWNAST
jgi:UDP-GlcNAc:undecaprenyl-phosphate GlcNAc-1-phosphate transferase